VASIWYASVEDVKSAADIAETARADAVIASKLSSATDAVDGLLKRRFAPVLETRYFEWPQDVYGSPRRLDLGLNELISVSTVVSGVGDSNTTITAAAVKLAPAEYGPPFSELVLADDANEVFTRGAVWERSIAVTGVYGYRLDWQPHSTTASALSGTGVTVSNGAGLGVGSILQIGAEALVVTGRAWVDSGNLVAVTLTASAKNDSFTVTDGNAFHVGEEILVGSERMRVDDIAGNTVMVTRAVNGSGLAVHTAVAAIYVQRRLAVDRAQLGTTAVDQAGTGVAVSVFRFPGLVHELCVAEAQVMVQQSRAAWARTAGSGENASESTGRGLLDLRKQAYRRYGRVRIGAV
jgi:hypothetical protein